MTTKTKKARRKLSLLQLAAECQVNTILVHNDNARRLRMKAKNSFIVLLFLFVPGFWMLPAAGQDASTNMTIVKEKILADRKLFVASNLDLTEAQGQAFWPIYDSYVQDLQKLGARAKGELTEEEDEYLLADGNSEDEKDN